MTASTEAGRVLAGRYRLLSPLGTGGMGTVWLAEDELLARRVAVKEISPPAGVTDPEREMLRQRTLREARMAARLSHPNVVTIYDVVNDDARPWIVMELIPSRSLRDVVQEDGPLSPQQAAKAGLQVLAALNAAHALGIMHRDVKPGNVLVDADGRAVLADFGIARAQDSPTLTTSGVLIGSPSYIAPERARGEPGDAASDLWSLGATLYALVEGRPPYDREGALPTLMAVVSEEPDPPRRAGVLWPAISGLLRRDAASRLAPDEAERMLRQVAGTGSAQDTAPLGPLFGGTEPIPGADRAPAGGRLQEAERTRAFHPQTTGPPDPARLAQPPPDQPPPAQPQPPGLAGGSEPGPPVTPEPAGQPGTAPGPRAGPGAGQAPPEPEPAVVAAGAVPAALPGDVQGPGSTGPPAQSREPAGTSAAGTAGPDTAPATASAAPSPPASPRPLIHRTGRKPRAWVIAAVALVMAAGGTVAGLIAANQHHALATGRSRPSAGPSAPSNSTPGATSAPATSTVQPSPARATASRGAGGPAAIPAGYHEFHNSTGFSIAVPNGWRVSHQGHYVYLLPPAGSLFLLIDQSDQPQPNPLADWRQQEANRMSSYPGYHRIRLQAVHYPPAEKAADWEFTYYHDGVLTHVLNRNVLANAHHAYALYWSTPASEWHRDWHIFRALAQTFRPAPG